MKASFLFLLTFLLYFTNSKKKHGKPKPKPDKSFIKILSDMAPHTFDFGVVTDSDKTLYKVKGVIASDDKVTVIPMKLKDCHELRFVQVNITTLSTLPAVSVDFRTQAVTIRYSWVQLTRSLYSLIAKGRSRCAYANKLKSYYGITRTTPAIDIRRKVATEYYYHDHQFEN